MTKTGNERKYSGCHHVHQNQCPYWKISPLLLFWGRPIIWDLLSTAGAD
ncbi:unnamed protein product [Staurois parvus]|uniref:Uncharacterized protein n=1 Tax=Staurois parvus TaxID=386267 RepID=A0ABN9CFX7_9NEOB|nr:unnamed protein product [Staurois parvus]